MPGLFEDMACAPFRFLTPFSFIFLGSCITPKKRWEGRGKGFITRSIPQRVISLPFGLRSPLKRNHARSALIVDSSSHALLPKHNLDS